MLPRISLLALLALPITPAASADDTRWISYVGSDGETVWLDDNRRPSLHTEDFGDCQGDSAVNVTRFDAAYYKDNMTVQFHLQGNSAILGDSVILYMGVFAYGEGRFDLTFNPCAANIMSLCPINASVPIEAEGIIPVNQADVAAIPPIALSIPDFEGEAILRIFSNTTQSEIGCYSAVVTNGHSFSHPASVGTILGLFMLVAIIASFATAMYGDAVPTMRLHYAHSLSVAVVFAVFQHIFYSGALSVNWPSVLVAWWSNFAWAGGMIYSSSMQSSIDRLIGANIGNTSHVGAAGVASGSSELAGGSASIISSIYKRMAGATFADTAAHPRVRNIAAEIYGPETPVESPAQSLVERSLHRRAIADASSGYQWYGEPVRAGLPLPGNYSGFAGTLGQQGIAASNAFMTGFLWFLITLVLVVASVVGLKWGLELLARCKLVQKDRLRFFRQHWMAYVVATALRICFIAWFMMMFLTVFQFTYESSDGVDAVAAIVFLTFLIGMAGLVAYAVQYKRHAIDANRRVAGKRFLGVVPYFSVDKSPLEQQEPEHDKRGKNDKDMSSDRNIHDDAAYTMKFGWLAARFRRTRWWFFAFWLAYELARAMLYAGASGHAMVQVFGLLVIEVTAVSFIVWAQPFEGKRLNVLVVYCLGFSKVATVALSAAFHVQFNLARIPTTIIGVVIIVIQGILTIVTMMAIVVGALSSYMSVSRNREAFRPRKWHARREKYFDHLDRVVNDIPPELPVQKSRKEKKAEKRAEKAAVAAAAAANRPTESAPADEPASGFEMKGVRRIAKIEDEDTTFMTELSAVNASHTTLDRRPPSVAEASRSATGRRSRAASLQSLPQTTLPFGARSHRPSWNPGYAGAADGADDAPEPASPPPIDMASALPNDAPTVRWSPPPAPSAPSSRSNTMPARMAPPSPLPSPPPPTDPVAAVRPCGSSASLRVGGAVSSRDVIGMVPMPTTRPRSGTGGSLRGADDAVAVTVGSRRASRHLVAALSPARENEEWGGDS